MTITTATAPVTTVAASDNADAPTLSRRIYIVSDAAKAKVKIINFPNIEIDK